MTWKRGIEYPSVVIKAQEYKHAVRAAVLHGCLCDQGESNALIGVEYRGPPVARLHLCESWQSSKVLAQPSHRLDSIGESNGPQLARQCKRVKIRDFLP